MASDGDVDSDYLGPDLKLDMVNLSPASGLNVGSIPRSITTVPKDIQPDVTSQLVMPLSTTAMPKVAELQSFAPQPGQPVDLSPPNPIKMVQAQEPRNNGKGLFGSNAMIIPDYKEDAATKPTPDTGNPLDLYEQNQREIVKRKTKEAQSPFMQFFYRSEAEKAQEEIGQGYKNIQEVQQQRQTQKTNQQMADNFGLTRKMPSTADAAAIHEEALREWRENGNIKAYQALQGAGQGARADLYKDEAMTSLGKKTGHAAAIIDRLGNAQTDVEYNKLRNEIVNSSKDSKHDYSSLGLNENSLPKTRQEWQKNHGAMLGELNKAATMVETYKQQQHQLSMAVPIDDEKIAKPVVDSKTFSNGEVIPNTTAHSLPGAGGVRGALAQPGSKDIANFASEGPGGWNNSTPQNVKTVTEQLGSEEFKGAIGKYKMVKDFATLANNNKLYTSAAGVALIEDALGAIGRDVAEGSKAAGSIGLVKILDAKFGGVEGFLNRSAQEVSAYKAWMDGGKKGAQPRLSAQTIAGIKDIANFKMTMATEELGRLEGPVGTAGRYGIGLNKVGLDKETQELLKPAWDQAVQRTRLDYDKYPSIIKGDQRVILPQGSDVKGMVPAGSYAASIPTNVEKPAPPAEPGGKDIPPVAGPPAGSVPPAIRNNPVGQQVYAAAGQVAHNITQNPTVSSNTALIATSSAQSESAFNPNATHDVDKTTGKPIGQGLYGHNADRLKELQRFAGQEPTGKPGAPIPAETQARFFARETMEAAKTDPFIAKTLNDPNASAEDLTRVQMRLEKPEGYKKGEEEKAPSWNKRLAATQTLMQKQETPAAAVAAAPAALPYPNPKNREEMLANYNAGQRMSPEEKAVSDNLRQQRLAQSTKSAAHIAPAALGTAGAVIGSAAGPAGSVAGGVSGGALGGTIENYFTGAPEDQNPAGYLKSGAIGAAKGGIAGIPGGGILPTAARVVGSGLVGGGEEALKGGDTAHVVNAAGGSMLGAVAGEAFGQALGMAGHQIYSRFSGVAKAEIQAAAEVLHNQQAKTMDATGKMVENKAYTAAEKTIKTAGLDPEHAAYAFGTVNSKATKGEAFTQRPGAIEQREAGKELERIKGKVGDAGADAGVKPWAPTPGMPPARIKGGPVESINTGPNSPGKIATTYMPEAKQAEDWLQKKTANVGEWWGNAANARSELLQHERDAIKAGNTHRADAMRDIADTVRKQQDNMAKRVLPPDQYKALMQDLHNADVRYRKALEAGGDDIVKTIAAGGAKANQAKSSFDALAHNDPLAQRYMNQLTAVEKHKGATGLGVMMAASGAMTFVPVIGHAAAAVGAVMTLARAKQMASDYMIKRGAGHQVSFKDLMLKDTTIAQNLARSGSAAVGAGVGGQIAQEAAAP